MGRRKSTKKASKTKPDFDAIALETAMAAHQCLQAAFKNPAPTQHQALIVREAISYLREIGMEVMKPKSASIAEMLKAHRAAKSKEKPTLEVKVEQ